MSQNCRLYYDQVVNTSSQWQTSQRLSAQSSTAHAGPSGTVELDRLFKKLTWRVMPLFCMCVMLNYLDRTSLAFASIQMLEQLDFSPEVLGLGGGLFFLSYCLVQVPSNMLCMRLGVQRWLSGLMLCWGIVATLFAAVQHKWQFYLLRVLLGLAESGTFPAVWYGIALWFPPDRTSVPYALVNASVAVSQVLAAPMAAALLNMDGVAGLAGWKWVFIGEGIPSIALAVMLPYLLPASPTDLQKGSCLDAEELALLSADRHKANSASCPDSQEDSTARLAATKGLTLNGSSTAAAAAADVLPVAVEASQPVRAAPPWPMFDWHLLLQVAKVWQIWFLGCTEAVKLISVMALLLWLPVMVQSLLSGSDPTQLVTSAHNSSAHSSTTGIIPVLLTSIPYTCAALLTTSLAALAQRTGNPLLYSCLPNLVSGAAIIAFPWVVRANRAAGFVMLSLSVACGYCSSPHPMAAITQIVARAVPTAASAPAKATSVPADAQGTGLALPIYNTVATLGGFFGPWLLGVSVERFGGFSAGAVVMGMCMLAAGCAVLLLWCLHAPTAQAGRVGASGTGPHRYTPAALMELPRSTRGSPASISDPGAAHARKNVLTYVTVGGKSSVGHSQSDGRPADEEQLLQAVEDQVVSRDALVSREGSTSRARGQRAKHTLRM